MFGLIWALIGSSLAVADKIEDTIEDARYREECRKNGEIVYMTSLGKHRLVSNNRPVIEKTDSNGDFIVEDLYTHEVYYNYSEVNRIKKRKEDERKNILLMKENEEIRERARLKGDYYYRRKNEVCYRRVEDDIICRPDKKLLNYRYQKSIVTESNMIMMMEKYFFAGYRDFKLTFDIKKLNDKEKKELIDIIIKHYNELVDRNISCLKTTNNKSECLKVGIIFEHITYDDFLKKYGYVFAISVDDRNSSDDGYYNQYKEVYLIDDEDSLFIIE